MFRKGDEVCIASRTGVWVVKDADERFNNAMMLVHEEGASGFVLLAVRGVDCTAIGGK